MPKKKKKQRGPNHICGLVGEGEETWTRFMEPMVQRAFLHQGEIRGKNIIILHVDSSGLFLIYIYMLEYKFHIN
jgi:hypothetical protein